MIDVPSTDRLSRDEMLMEIAHVVAKRSTCSRAQVGCVIAYDGRILATGYNGAPRKLPHCDHQCTCPDGNHMQLNVLCTMFGPCKTAVHAECNAIAFAAKHGVKLEGSTLYTTMSPCLSCAQLIVNAGIRRVWSDAEYRDELGMDLLRAAGLYGDPAR